MTKREAWTWVVAVLALTGLFGWAVLVFCGLALVLARLRGKFTFACTRCGHVVESWRAYPKLPDPCPGCVAPRPAPGGREP